MKVLISLFQFRSINFFPFFLCIKFREIAREAPIESRDILVSLTFIQFNLRKWLKIYPRSYPVSACEEEVRNVAQFRRAAAQDETRPTQKRNAPPTQPGMHPRTTGPILRLARLG